MSTQSPNSIEFALTGEMPSKKNRWEFGNGRVFIPKAVQDELDDFLWQLKSVIVKNYRVIPLSGQIHLQVYFFTKKAKDLDNMLTALQDLLQKSGIIKNDKDICSIVAKRYDVPKDPQIRVELKLL